MVASRCLNEINLKCVQTVTYWRFHCFVLFEICECLRRELISPPMDCLYLFPLFLFQFRLIRIPGLSISAIGGCRFLILSVADL